ncbi:MAG TPA: creatininase family protein [Dehalococcoidia bacterium]|nr:creatininase family protein [Dehalococcoidia bacterium]
MTLKSLWLEDLTWPEVRAALDAGVDTALIVVGATEQHGPHLPLAVDTLCGRAIAERVARRLDRAVIAPVVSVGYSPYHMHLPGTLTIGRETMIALLTDYCTSLARHGFRNLAILSSHGGNNRPIARAVEAIGPQVPDVRVVAFVDGSAYGRVQRATAARFGITPPVAGVHAGEAETSQVLAIRPELVVGNAIEPGYVGNLADAREQLARDPASVSPSGVLGDPRPARAERGAAYLDDLADYIAEWLLPRLLMPPID